jgi:hypothetical protein
MREVPALIRFVAMVGALVTIGCRAPEASAELAFYATTRDAAVGAGNPTRYEKIEPPVYAGGDPTYVDRTTPKFVVQDREIESITVEERRTAMGEKEVQQEFERRRGGTGPVYYEVAFTLKTTGAAQARQFFKTQAGVRLGVRFGKKTIGLAVPLGPFEGDEFRIYVSTLTRAELEATFAPVKSKVRWK